MTNKQNLKSGKSDFTGMTGPGRGSGALLVRDIRRAKNAGGTLRRLSRYLYPYRSTLVIIIAAAITGTGMALSTPYLVGQTIDLLGNRQTDALRLPLLLMLAAYLISSGAQLVQGVLIAHVSQKAMQILRADLFNHMQTLPLKFFDTQAQGDLMSRLTNDMDAVNQVLTNHAAQLFTGLFTLAGIVIIIFFIDPWLAAGSMLAFPLMIGLVGLVGKKTRKKFQGYQKNLGNLNASLEETYSGQRVVLAFGQEQSALEKFDQANEAARTTGIAAMTLSLLVMPMMGILSNLNIAVVCGLGGWLAVRGMVSVGTIAAFISYSRRFAEPLRQLGNIYNQIQAALAGAERIFEIMDMVPDSPDPPDACRFEQVAGEVRFDHVTFSYIPGIPVLYDISLHARPGQRIALVGHTGAGKTTLINLLSRFYDNDQGEIRIDGIDIRSATRESLRRQLGVVLQQTFLFSESVLENIRYGRLNATDEEVFAAARTARADGFIRRLPQGYHTLLSERGSNLSQGQRQLLAIARAILADPAILVLDEATSSVDTRTEALIQQALDQLMRGRTSFVIAHRLSTIANADQVIVIDKGRIIEKGSPRELLAMQGSYYQLYQSQFKHRPG
ncbi:ABC transporter ATP-binding protein [Desulfobacter vibrioformis]|uniref:ABC transporter ATP-binding protein n=1 Tax=Desulfobacter vibrioformis TaxID=34031 RepID=UPI000550DFE6|nr:ABC transporter ATP-binding protein [Desulfobacter vibrioformis]